MEKEFELEGYQLKVVFKKNKRSKGIRITLKNNQDFLVSYPWFVSSKKAEEFFLRSKDWALKSLKIVKDKKYSNLLGWGTKEDYFKNKARAKSLVKERIKEINSYYRFPVGRIYVRNQQTRWGSCSSNYNLSFNYRVLFLPDDLVDYLIVHELCHLQEMNHSKKFWELVSKQIPDYKNLSKKLRKL